MTLAEAIQQLLQCVNSAIEPDDVLREAVETIEEHEFELAEFSEKLEHGD